MTGCAVPITPRAQALALLEQQQSKIGNLLPSTRIDEEVNNYSTVPSGRRATLGPAPTLRLFPPFVAFRLDVEDRKRWRDLETRTIELAKPMTEFTRPEHMAMFGRPLWGAYDNPERMYSVAKFKLIGGGRGGTFNPLNANHVFAVLSFRMSLDVCLENPLTLPLVRTAVNSYLRLVTSMHQPTGLLHTATPSEPVLAKSAMELLCDGMNWCSSIKTFASELLQRGIVEKGLKGELYSCLVLILAHDWLRWGARVRVGDTPVFAPTFTVDEFLVSLYPRKHHGLIRRIPAPLRQARMNFTHFVPTNENLSHSVIPELCHDLLRRGAALQLAPAQPTYDKLIPIYFGKEGDTFDPSQCGVIMVQDKNKAEATTVRRIFKEHFTVINLKTDNPVKLRKTKKQSKKSQKPLRDDIEKFVFKGMKHPILFLLFDMGVSPTVSPPIQVSHSNGSKPQVWAVHSRGHSKEVFGCLEHLDPGGMCEGFFLAPMPATGPCVDIARENMMFHKLARQFRRADVGAADDTDSGLSDSAQEIEGSDEGSDEDTQMKDA
ncbi:MAG: hypothetical protein M1840_003360 [Geoglossum simile]|nr:MAG: hypothetical protein M1840_003360 [Geoglossum simile]